jgi:hypothetical protein
MSKRQVQKMFQLMASGEPVELTSAMASVKKLARLAFIAQRFGYEYADVRQSGGQNNALKMLIVPDPSPQAQQRAAQNWAQFPQAASGGALPPFVPDALELLKARINFDLTGKSAEKRMGLGALGLSIGMAIGVVRASGSAVTWVIASWAGLMAILGIGFVVTRKRNAKFAARLQAAGFAPVTDETGRVRYLPPGGQLPGHGNPFGTPMAGPYAPGAPMAGPYPPGAPMPGSLNPGPYAPGAPMPGPYTPGPYAQQQSAPQQSAPGPYPPGPHQQQSSPQQSAAPSPYAPQQSYGRQSQAGQAPQQPPYAQPPHPQPPHAQPPHARQPQWQPPQQ